MAGGHLTPDPEDDLFAGVVNLESVRLVLGIAPVTGLTVIAANVSSAYLHAFTTEKVYVIAGKEFGPMEGQILVIIKALYGLKTSGARWHQTFAESLRALGFRPSTADYDMWIRNNETHYEYITVIVDDLLIASKDPKGITEELKDLGYELKSVGTPEYYNGADIKYDTDNDCWTLSSETYIKTVCERIEKLLEVKLRNNGSPLVVGDHPEQDETEELYGKDITMYQMLIGCAQWAVNLGRFDIQYATNTLARYSVMPKRGHFERALRVFGYLQHNKCARLSLNTSPVDLDMVDFKEHNWMDLYPDATWNGSRIICPNQKDQESYR